ncbi:MAG TPA: alpha/beta hydrolase [Gammaproteobacteria bacterium]|nr:alpha/beta hydrolase [Gammaproteobacteria bacterium]
MPPGRRPGLARLGLALVLILALSACSNLFFVPMKTLLRTPDELGLDFENVFIDSSDGVRLYAWFLPAEETARGTILFLHGNAENISTHIGGVYWLPARGYNVLLLDYRGYGLSSGEPSLQGATDDVQAALRWLLARTEGQPVAVLGQSLGGSLGVVAIDRADLAPQIRALILDSAFSDYRLIAREKLAGFWLTWPLQYPLSWLISDHFAPTRAIARISPTPVLIIHGEDDNIVPPHHARQLYRAAREPKALWLVPDTGHIGALARPEIRDRLVKYLDRTMGRRPSSNNN